MVLTVNHQRRYPFILQWELNGNLVVAEDNNKRTAAEVTCLINNTGESLGCSTDNTATLDSTSISSSVTRSFVRYAIWAR